MLDLRPVFLIVLLLWSRVPVSAQDESPPAESPSSENAPSEVRSLADLPVSMEAQPYQIHISLASSAEPVEEIQSDIRIALERSVGSLWNVDLDVLPPANRTDGELLRRWSTEKLRATYDATSFDVWFGVTVQRQGSQRKIFVRAWQPRFDWISSVQEVALYEPRETAGKIVQLCWKLFRPEILIEQVDQNSLHARIRGGDLRSADPAFALFRPGDCLSAWLLYYDRDKSLKKRQELPWTYVRLDTIDGAMATGTVVSGLRLPLSGKMRGRIDKVAVAARPVYPETRLQLGVQNQPTRLLAGYRLEFRTKLPERRSVEEQKTDENTEGKTEDDQAKPQEEEVVSVLTDRLGNASLVPDAEHPLIWVYVYSGSLMLARVPTVPGAEPEMRLEVPDDSTRLQVEGDLQLLQGDLINLVAERNTLIASIRASIKKGDWSRADLMRKQIDGLPTRDSFINRLAGIRVPAMSAAKAKKDRHGEVRIDRLCNDVSELIARYLDPEKLKLVTEELDALLKDAQKDAKEIKDESK